MTPADAQTILEENFAPWIKALTPRVTEIGEARTVLEIPITEGIQRVGGIVCGQAMAALADTAMVFACMGKLGKMEPVGTVTLDTQFLKPAKGETLRAEAEVIREGRSMMFARCTLLTTPGDTPVAHATATFAR